jgi:hypothetical protein
MIVDASASMKGRDLPPEAAQGQPSTNLDVDLPPLLATPGPVVVVTDRRLVAFPDIPGKLRVIGVGKRGFNAGVTAVTGAPIADGRWRVFLTVEAHGAPGPVEGRLRTGYSEESITVTPGRPLEVVRDVGYAPGDARIEFAGDGFAADDSVALRSEGGEFVQVRGVSACPPFGRAFLAAGARVDSPVGGGLVLQRGPHGAGLFLGFPSGGALGREIEGKSVFVADHPLTRDLRIDPSATLGFRSATAQAQSGGTVLLSDGDGPLVSLRERPERVEFSFHPGGTWVERDPSFVVFAKNLVEYAAGGPARLEATGVLDSKETREAAEGETFGDLAAALAEARRPDPASRASLAAAALLAGAALLASAWFAGRHR